MCYNNSNSRICEYNKSKEYVIAVLKKKKIKQYLEQKSVYSIFDDLLRLYISDALQNKLQSWELTHISIYIDWKNDYKLIDLQAKCHDYFYEWQFDENECSFMVYIDNEPDEPTCLTYSMFKNVDDLLLKMKSLVPTIK